MQTSWLQTHFLVVGYASLIYESLCRCLSVILRQYGSYYDNVTQPHDNIHESQSHAVSHAIHWCMFCKHGVYATRWCNCQDISIHTAVLELIQIWQNISTDIKLYVLDINLQFTCLICIDLDVMCVREPTYHPRYIGIVPTSSLLARC